MNEKYIPIQIESDEDGHDFIIPNELADKFSEVKERCYSTDDFADMDEFDKYATGGCVSEYQLFISESEMKRLTGE